jgi:hypothetical protein
MIIVHGPDLHVGTMSASLPTRDTVKVAPMPVCSMLVNAPAASRRHRDPRAALTGGLQGLDDLAANDHEIGILVSESSRFWAVSCVSR